MLKQRGMVQERAGRLPELLTQGWELMGARKGKEREVERLTLR